ncbi:Ankyrin repeat protein [Legionella busanensis]|uniref:Ankyrin repeat protein n=1 Tax=Legionella busanensis TaxID=190655 RepID=A0A378JN20_9GAMM|nr:ankyrin repeat domain-containing protein [Legionella busanensis]STX52088.1 Ankyrin repeat protein [Legionella busanensis]
MKNLSELQFEFNSLSWELYKDVRYIKSKGSKVPSESTISSVLTTFYSESLIVRNEEETISYLARLETRIDTILTAQPQSTSANDRVFIGFLLENRNKVDILFYRSRFGWIYHNTTDQENTLGNILNPAEKGSIAKAIGQNFCNENDWSDLAFTIQLRLFKDDPRGPKLEALRNVVLEADSISATESLIAYLIDVGANLDFLNEEGLALLHIAAKNGSLGIVNHLIRGRATVDLRDEKGFTPLFWAVRNKELSVVEALMNAGADCNCSVPMSINELQRLVANESSQVKERMGNFIKRKSSLVGAAPISISSCELAIILAHSKIIMTVISLNSTPRDQLFKLLPSLPNQLPELAPLSIATYSFLSPSPISGKRKTLEIKGKEVPTEQQRRNGMF